MQVSKVSAKTMQAIVVAIPGTREHGLAVSAAIAEMQARADWTQKMVAEHDRLNDLLSSDNTTVSGMKCRVISVKKNGVWITRRATEAEQLMQGVEYTKERVSISAIAY